MTSNNNNKKGMETMSFKEWHKTHPEYKVSLVKDLCNGVVMGAFAGMFLKSFGIFGAYADFGIIAFSIAGAAYGYSIYISKD